MRALTKQKALPAAERMKDSLRRILEEPVEIGMVKMADRISNLVQPPGHWTVQKIAAYRDESRLIGERNDINPLPLARGGLPAGGEPLPEGERLSLQGHGRLFREGRGRQRGRPD